MKKEEYIKTPNGSILGRIETDSNGDQTARDQMGRILGYYRASRNVTTDSHGRIIAQGNIVSALIVNKLF